MKLFLLFLFTFNLSLVLCNIIKKEANNIEICKDFVSFLNKNDYYIKENCCNEPGIKCDPQYGITEIKLKFNPGKIDFTTFPSLKYTDYLKSLTIEGDVFQGILPSVFFDMNLRVLKIMNSNIHVIPENININNQLYEIDLNQNKISKFPYQFNNFKSLEILVISNNYITDFPYHFEKFEKLSYLDLSNNKILKFPYKLGSLKNLSYLNLNNNEISGSLTDEINDFEKLSNLSVNNNKMAGELYIPQNISNMEVNDNHFDSVKLKSNDNKLFSFYANNNNFNNEALNQLKKCPNLHRISLVNNSGVSHNEYIERSEGWNFKDGITFVAIAATYISAFICIKRFQEGNIVNKKNDNEDDVLPSYEEAIKARI